MSKDLAPYPSDWIIPHRQFCLPETAHLARLSKEEVPLGNHLIVPKGRLPRGAFPTLDQLGDLLPALAANLLEVFMSVLLGHHAPADLSALAARFGDGHGSL